MSHSITISFSNIKNYVETCDNLLNDVNETERILDNIDIKEKATEDIKQKILNLKEKMIALVGQQVEFEFLQELSTLEKEVINAKYFADNIVKQKAYEKIDMSILNFKDKVLKYGTMAESTLTYMRQNNISLTDQSFESTLNSLRQQQIILEEKEKILNYCYSFIDNLNISDEIKYELKNQAKQCNSIQEFSDILPAIKSKQEELQRSKILINDLINTFKKMNFSLDKKFGIKEHFDSSENKFVFSFVLVDPSNHNAKIKVDSNNQVKYQLGNYEGHLCNKTTEKLLEEFEKLSYLKDIKSVKRDISNAKPLAFEAKLFNSK